MLAVACDHRVPAGAGQLIRADRLAARLPRRAWQRFSAGEGAKGHRYYDWAWIGISDSRPGHRWLLIRRTPRTGELAFYRCYAPHRVPLATLVKVAGLRWTVEENFQAGKALAGLDEHQVRRWTPGTGGSPWPCSPPPSSPSPPPPSMPVSQPQQGRSR